MVLRDAVDVCATLNFCGQCCFERLPLDGQACQRVLRQQKYGAGTQQTQQPRGLKLTLALLKAWRRNPMKDEQIDPSLLKACVAGTTRAVFT